jgi:integrase
MPKRGSGIYQRRADGLWVATYEKGKNPDGTRQRGYVYGTTMKEAAAKRRAAVEDFEAGIVKTPASGMTVGQWLGRWLDAKEATGKFKPATIRNYRDVIDAYIRPFVGGIKLTALTAEHVEGMLQGLASKSSSTQKRAWSILTASLNQAVKRDYVRKNVAADVDPPAVRHAERPVLTAAQARDLLGELKAAHDWLLPVYVLALHNGLREGEILGLRWSDVDFEEGMITVTGTLDRTDRVRVAPKTAKSRRTLKITTEVVGILQEQQLRQNLEETQGSDGFVFTSDQGTPICDSTVRRHFRNISHRLGLPALHFHDLRHTYAVLAREAGVPLEEISWNLGHASIRITADVYGWTSEAARNSTASDAIALVLSS